jgi:hypothetical protein
LFSIFLVGTGHAICRLIMHRPVKLLALGLFLLAGCAPSTAYQKDSSDGYCFRAEGLSQARCYAQYETCSRREKNIGRVAQIQSECEFQSSGVLSVKSVARTMSAQH